MYHTHLWGLTQSNCIGVSRGYDVKTTLHSWEKSHVHVFSAKMTNMFILEIFSGAMWQHALVFKLIPAAQEPDLQLSS